MHTFGRRVGRSIERRKVRGGLLESLVACSMDGTATEGHRYLSGVRLAVDEPLVLHGVIGHELRNLEVLLVKHVLEKAQQRRRGQGASSGKEVSRERLGGGFGAVLRVWGCSAHRIRLFAVRHVGEDRREHMGPIRLWLLQPFWNNHRKPANRGSRVWSRGWRIGFWLGSGFWRGAHAESHLDSLLRFPPLPLALAKSDL